MANQLLRSPDKNSGPAVAGREPILLPDHRKRAVRKVKDMLDM